MYRLFFIDLILLLSARINSYLIYRKALLDLEFLQSCKKEKLIPKFLEFKVANNWLGSSEAYVSCPRRLLNQEIFIKYK